MLVYLTICFVCTAAFVLSMVFFDDIDLGDALDFGDDGGSWLSLRSILLFGVGFGAVGMLAMQAEWGHTASAIAGVFGGAVGYAIGIGVAVLLNKQQSNSIINRTDLVGKEGIVTVPISVLGIGQVQIGTYTSAAASQSTAIEAGEQVKVLSDLGNLFLVERKGAL